jgi:hypothetical protein
MTNDHTTATPRRPGEDWDPMCPLADGLAKVVSDKTKRSHESNVGESFQRLEEARLGNILVKAWTEGYNSAEEIIEDVEAAASKMGITVCEDDVDIGQEWEEVFEVRNGELVFRSPAGKTEKSKHYDT